jgi:Alpha/beta hydrolase domain
MDQHDVRTPTRLFAPPTGAGKVHLADPDLPEAYVEEEYLVSGTANLYEHGADRHLAVTDADHGYATRILVRYPRDPGAFSGDVILDALHPEGGQSTLWGFLREYLMERGDAFCSVTTRREPFNPLIQPPQTAVDRLKGFDPDRYGPVDFDDSGLTWDIISQVGRMLRADTAENPLRAYPPHQLLAGGFSGSGATMLFYVNEGFPASARMPDGSPIFDGYLVGEPSRYPGASSTAGDDDPPGDYDAHQKVQPCGVPIIQLYSMDFTLEMGRGRYRTDSDEPGERFRQWVVPGAYHAGRSGGRILAELSGAQAPTCTYPTSTIPLDHYFPLAIDHLKRWARGESVPPYAPTIQTDAAGQPVLDTHGNPIGGVPCAAMELPTASHPLNGPDITCRLLGGEVPFPPEKLREVYGTRESFLLRMERRVRELIGLGWLLPSQAKDVMDQARTVDFGRAPS